MLLFGWTYTGRGSATTSEKSAQGKNVYGPVLSKVQANKTKAEFRKATETRSSEGGKQRRNTFTQPAAVGPADLRARGRLAAPV